MTFKERLALYDNELDNLLIDCFEPYASMVKENKEALEECREVLGRPIITTYNNLILGSCTIATLQ